jgi:hypothetical protein
MTFFISHEPALFGHWEIKVSETDNQVMVCMIDHVTWDTYINFFVGKDREVQAHLWIENTASRYIA